MKYQIMKYYEIMKYFSIMNKKSKPIQLPVWELMFKVGWVFQK